MKEEAEIHKKTWRNVKRDGEKLEMARWSKWGWERG